MDSPASVGAKTVHDVVGEPASESVTLRPVAFRAPTSDVNPPVVAV